MLAEIMVDEKLLIDLEWPISESGTVPGDLDLRVLKSVIIMIFILSGDYIDCQVGIPRFLPSSFKSMLVDEGGPAAILA